jgi:hypothetical protein
MPKRTPRHDRWGVHLVMLLAMSDAHCAIVRQLGSDSASCSALYHTRLDAVYCLTEIYFLSNAQSFGSYRPMLKIYVRLVYMKQDEKRHPSVHCVA